MKFETSKEQIVELISFVRELLRYLPLNMIISENNRLLKKSIHIQNQINCKNPDQNQLCIMETYVSSIKQLVPSISFCMQTEWCGQTNVFREQRE